MSKIYETDATKLAEDSKELFGCGIQAKLGHIYE